MLASRVCEHARRVIVDDLDVGDQRRTGIQALEQIVREQRVFRHAAVERGDERVDVVEPFAREDAFVEEILIDVRDRGGVRVHAGVAGVGPGEQRPGRARHRDADARLQNAVAFGDAPGGGVETGAIQRVRDDADEGLGDVTRQARVGVERDAVTHRRKNVQLADLLGEAGVRCASQQPVEFFDLPAFPLPSHPRVFPRVPAPRAVEQEEAIGMVGAELLIEVLDAGARGGENRGDRRAALSTRRRRNR